MADWQGSWLLTSGWQHPMQVRFLLQEHWLSTIRHSQVENCGWKNGPTQPVSSAQGRQRYAKLPR